MESVRIVNIDCLITISWMHGASDEYLESVYHAILEQHHIKYIIVDVRNVEKMKKDFSTILTSAYHCISREKYIAAESEIWVETYEYREA